MKMGLMLFDGEYRPQEIDFIGINILPLWNLEQEYKLTVGPNNQTSELLIKSTPAIANRRSIGKVPWDESHIHLRMDIAFKFKPEFLEVEFTNFKIYPNLNEGHDHTVLCEDGTNCELKMPSEIKLKFKTNAEFSSQMSKDNTLFVYSLTMLPLLLFCTLVLCMKACRFTMGKDAMQAKSISTISLAMMAYWGLVTILIAGKYYDLGYINWWVAIGLQVIYFFYFFIIITILSAVLRAQMPGVGVNEIRKR
jgi:hypothetical protein